ncbi:MAG: F0F1 ATP synthase subunit delta [Betaproteobacteria bacterium]
MAELETVARPYAEAAYKLATEQNALPVWGEMIHFAAAVMADPAMQSAIDNPKLGAGQKEALFLSVCGDKLNVSGRNFVKVLIETGRVELLPQIEAMFVKLKNAAEGVAKAEIVSAIALTDTQVSELKTVLEKRFGKRIEATVAVDPRLIGGVRIVVGDQVVDGSIAGKLAAMATQLKS